MQGPEIGGTGRPAADPINSAIHEGLDGWTGTYIVRTPQIGEPG
jgi:hypothetical protein